MKYYKRLVPEKWEVYAFEADGSQDEYIKDDMYSISQDEAKEISSREPEDKVVLDILRSASSERNWEWPPSRYQEAIGQIAVSSSKIEVLIRTVIWHVAEVDTATGRAFTGKVRINELVDILKALVKLKAPYLEQAVTDVGGKIRDVFKRRAIYIHQVWTVQDGLPAVGKLFLERYEDKESLTTVSLSEMYELADDMNRVQGELMANILNPLLPRNNQ